MNSYESCYMCANIFLILVTWKFVIFFVAEEPTLIVIMSREFVARFQPSFSGHRFKHDREAKTFVTQ
jgi:hypothetical protein